MRYRYHQTYSIRKRRQEGGTRWNVIMRTFFFIVIGVCLALFYVWQNVQLVRMGFRIKEKERTVLELSKRSKAFEIDLSVLKMPSRIMARIREEGLELNIPEIWQIVRIQEEPILYEEDLVNLENFGSNSLINISGEQ